MLGCGASCAAVALTYTFTPLRAFPLLLAFPTVILSAWFLGMWGGVGCAIADVILVDQFLTRTQLRFSIGNVREAGRLAMFLLISILMGWAIRRLAEQREQLRNLELQERLGRANVERLLAEERARTMEDLRDRDEMLQMALRANGMGLWIGTCKGVRCTGQTRCIGWLAANPETLLQSRRRGLSSSILTTWPA